ncbi:MAG: glycosyltransferase family 2 protein [Candidatus Adiutrix sp.]|jgi:glycosyltransferase involved in cell wall biosynthesis|nr:glycosyltransferase family 2 protein [Candidatus Adiutrix sp.]
MSSDCDDSSNRRGSKISIVLPTYNGSRWLADSIESVLRQTEEDWELIVVNDCSTDKTLEIAERYARQDPRIKVRSNATNKKLPASLNIGFSHAVGSYRTWTSDDNMFKPNALSVMAGYLDAHPHIDMVSARMDIINEDGTFKESFLERAGRKPVRLSYICNIGAAFMYRTAVAEKIGGYNEDRFCAEDYDYWCRIALAGAIAYINDNVYLYRENSQSLTATQKERVMEKSAIIKNEYKQQFVERFKLTWWQREKLEYLIDKTKFRKTFVLFWLRSRFCELFCGAFFFWNRKLRRRFRTIMGAVKI